VSNAPPWISAAATIARAPMPAAASPSATHLTRLSVIVANLAALQVGVELQAVAVRIAHVELTRAPARVGDLRAMKNSPELVGEGVDVMRRESHDRSIAGNALEVVPLHRKARRVACHHRKPWCEVVVSEDLFEPELGIEGQRSAHVAHHQHGLDSFE